MVILALDLGTHCGWAVGESNQFQAGTWHLAEKKEITEWGKNRLARRHDPRICRLQSKVADAILEYAPKAIVFEDVEFASSRKQAHLWAAYRSVIWTTVCNLCPSVLVDCCPVGTLKKFATGSGSADKDMMARALFKQFPNQVRPPNSVDAKMIAARTTDGRTLDDNAVDSIWILKWAHARLSRAL